jgi:L-lactate utilization protein LutB
VNNSAVVHRELLPDLRSRFTVFDSYLEEIEHPTADERNYWEIPHLIGTGKVGEFEFTTKISGLDTSRPSGATKESVAILGVSAAAADDGTVFFIEHLDNISRELAEARKVFLIVGLEKLVARTDDGACITRSMGIFGLESVVMDIARLAHGTTSPAGPAGTTTRDRELHVVLLDNGRNELAASPFRELLSCISCRGCIRQCPVRPAFAETDRHWTPQTLAKDYVQGKRVTAGDCLHCETCRVNCPLDIDLPGMLWQLSRNRCSQVNPWLFQHTDTLFKAGSLVSHLTNWLIRFPAARIAAEKLFGIHRSAPLPHFGTPTFQQWRKTKGYHACQIRK